MYTTRSIVDVHLLDAMLLLFLLLDLRFDITHSIFHRSRLPFSVHRLFTALACRVVQSFASASICEGCTTKDLVVFSFTILVERLCATGIEA